MGSQLSVKDEGSGLGLLKLGLKGKGFQGEQRRGKEFIATLEHLFEIFFVLHP